MGMQAITVVPDHEGDDTDGQVGPDTWKGSLFLT